MMIVQIAGRLGKDPEARFTQSGQKVTTLTVAVNSRKGGKEETVWWRVTVWGDRLDKMISFLKKGSAVIITGEMNKPEIWTDKEGRPQVSVEMTAEIIKFSPSNTPQEGGNNSPAQHQQGANKAHAGSGYGDNSFGQESHGSSFGQGHSQNENYDDDAPPF